MLGAVTAPSPPSVCSPASLTAAQLPITVGVTKKQRPFCSYCKKYGHTKNERRKLTKRGEFCLSNNNNSLAEVGDYDDKDKKSFYSVEFPNLIPMKKIKGINEVVTDRRNSIVIRNRDLKAMLVQLLKEDYMFWAKKWPMIRFALNGAKFQTTGDTFQVDNLALLKSHVLSNAAKNVTEKFIPKRDGPYRIAEEGCPVSKKKVLVHSPERLPELEGEYIANRLSALSPRASRGRPSVRFTE
ncbi:hypothetical protein EVAR_16783_1 [Eumeta japonica]|uniref:Uncharacterized protein n=1 Tax=Eumeta variegata TaxID=151549 RepID=A0A4C1UMA6_EUMVA|nr:hypothetical protein EVAR_16783_1 [Eumeta japonica]